MRVLIVDDTADIADWLATAIAIDGNDGIDTRIKVTGFRDLLQPDAWTGVDVVVLDAIMPEVGGLEIARYLREYHPDIRIVVATGSIVAAEEATGLVDQVLLKPFTSEQLMEAIRQ